GRGAAVDPGLLAGGGVAEPEGLVQEGPQEGQAHDDAQHRQHLVAARWTLGHLGGRGRFGGLLDGNDRLGGLAGGVLDGHWVPPSRLATEVLVAASAGGWWRKSPPAVTSVAFARRRRVPKVPRSGAHGPS